MSLRDFFEIPGLCTDADFSYSVVETEEVAQMVNSLLIEQDDARSSTAADTWSPRSKAFPKARPALYIDIEGRNLGRNGTISLIQLLDAAQDHVFLIDVYALGSKAFDTPCSKAANSSAGSLRIDDTNKLDWLPTFRRILEKPTIPKVSFDVRNDNDALFSIFGVMLEGLIDLQVMEFAAYPIRHSSYNGSIQIRNRIRGLVSCIDTHLSLGWEAYDHIRDIKATGKAWLQETEGRISEKRPMSQEIVDYCVQDVVLLPMLYDIFKAKLTASLERAVLDTPVNRVLESRGK